MSNARNLCPLCRSKPATPEQTPFCSQGCRDRDLLKWLGDGYAIPGPRIDEELDSAGLDSSDDPSL